VNHCIGNEEKRAARMPPGRTAEAIPPQLKGDDCERNFDS
jgi:hypothetical protein